MIGNLRRITRFAGLALGASAILAGTLPAADAGLRPATRPAPLVAVSTITADPLPRQPQGCCQCRTPGKSARPPLQRLVYQVRSNFLQFLRRNSAIRPLHSSWDHCDQNAIPSLCDCACDAIPIEQYTDPLEAMPPIAPSNPFVDDP